MIFTWNLKRAHFFHFACVHLREISCLFRCIVVWSCICRYNNNNLPFSCRDFYKFSECFDDIMDCKFFNCCIMGHRSFSHPSLWMGEPFNSAHFIPYRNQWTYLHGVCSEQAFFVFVFCALNNVLYILPLPQLFEMFACRHQIQNECVLTKNKNFWSVWHLNV